MDQRTTISMIDAALDLAQRGWHVFPCSPATKQPLTQKALRTPATMNMKFGKVSRRTHAQ